MGRGAGATFTSVGQMVKGVFNTRLKWNEVKEGDVVLVLDQKPPQGQWPFGCIVETYPGKDGHTRVAKVQCGEKTVARPIHKLVPL